MLGLIPAVALSVVPLTLYMPPPRSLSTFMKVMDEWLTGSISFTLFLYPSFRLAWNRLLRFLPHTISSSR